jgi:FkbM family methyltransferase
MSPETAAAATLSASKRRLFELLMEERARGRTRFEERLERYERAARQQCRDNLQKVLAHLPAEAVVFDVGANVGVFTEELLAAHSCSSCHLFEPVREYFEILDQRLGARPGVHCHNLALGKEDGGLKTIFRSPTGSLGWNTFLREDPAQPSGSIPADMLPEECRMTSIDAFCEARGIDRIDLLKIDVEGYEGEVIAGGLRCLARLARKPVLLVEVGWGTHHPRWRENEAIYRALFSLGYPSVSFKGFTEDVVFKPL